MDVSVSRIPDFASKRRMEAVEASQSKQDGLIAYVACMVDVELPDDEPDGQVTPDE